MAPHDVIAINWHAAGLAELHRWAEAQAVIREAIERNPAATKPYYQLGKILIDDDCFSKAMECFDIVLDRDPQHPQALEWRITALRKLRRFSEAEEAAAGATCHLPRCPRLYVEHAWVASDQGREDEAVTRVERALAIDAHDSWALRSRMDFLRTARRFEEAEQAAAEAIERRPGNPDIHTAAAWVASIRITTMRRSPGLSARWRSTPVIRGRCAAGWTSCGRRGALAKPKKPPPRRSSAVPVTRTFTPPRPGWPAIRITTMRRSSGLSARWRSTPVIRGRCAAGWTSCGRRGGSRRLSRPPLRRSSAVPVTRTFTPPPPGWPAIRITTMRRSPGLSARWRSTPVIRGRCAAASLSCGRRGGSRRLSRPPLKRSNYPQTNLGFVSSWAD